MAEGIYEADSPYFRTEIVENNYLDILTYRRIPIQADDTIHTLTQTHAYRPDLLAHDLYGNSNLWWVFAVRNPNAFEDPVWDFKIGKKFYIPKKSTLEKALGI